MDADDDYSDGFGMDDMNDTSVPSFAYLKPAEIVELMSETIEHVNSVVQMPATTTRILLSHTKWDKQELLDKLTDEKVDEFFERAHVLNPFSKKPKRKTAQKKITCSICFGEFSKNGIVGLGCSHEYCKDCWCQYLTIKVVDDGHAESICCPASKCGIVVDDVTVMELVSDETVRQKYRHLMTNSFVQHDHSLRWCPSPGCSLAIKANRLLAYRQNCSCECGTGFCFNCGEQPHDPIPCELMKEWRKNDNDATIQYLTKYTKGCPKCCSLIEKNGGCNHMTCRKCNYEFCWICFGEWKGHGAQGCNTYKPWDKNENDQKRFQHYLKRYGCHKKSLLMEQGLASGTGSVKDKMNALQNMGMSWNDVQFLRKAIEILCESRKQLMFTYIFAYYVKQHNQKVIFEVNQNDLEVATEALSQYMEQDLPKDGIEKLKYNVIHKSNYCASRQKTMQEHIFDGFENDWWSFPSNMK